MVGDVLKQQIAAAAATSPTCASPVPRVPGRVLHVDGDYAAYYFAGDEATPPSRARAAMLEGIDAALMYSGAESAVVHLTMPGSHKAWRFAIATVKPYQGQRAGKKPKNWQYLRQVMGEFNAMYSTAREADDALAYYACNTNNAVLWYADKDMRQLPGLHLTWKEKRLIEVPAGAYSLIGSDGKQYGLKWFWLQMLMGDAADNIPGLPKHMGRLVGEARAAKALSGIENSAWASEIVFNMYSDCYGEDVVYAFVEQALLLWLHRSTSPGNMASRIGDFIAGSGVSADVAEIIRASDVFAEMQSRFDKVYVNGAN